MDSIFDKHTKEHLREFIAAWPEQVNADEAFERACAALRYYGGSKHDREETRPSQELETRWYESLERGAPDYGVYSEPLFLSDIWACWKLYSRKYVQAVRTINLSVGSVVDLGCGFGYTTAALKELYPSADVFGTNFEDCPQWKFASALGKERGLSLAPDVQKLNRQIDLVFASEYFEHIESPVGHLHGVLDVCRPKYLVLANAFGTISVGHFVKYKYRDSLGLDGAIDGKHIGKVFNQALRSTGYARVKTGFWNDRPAVWQKTT